MDYPNRRQVDAVKLVDHAISVTVANFYHNESLACAADELELIARDSEGLEKKMLMSIAEYFRDSISFDDE